MVCIRKENSWHRKIDMKQIAILLLFFLPSVFPSGKNENGFLSKVIDGDTVYIKTTSTKPIKVRLAFIDAPELNQPYGKAAKLFLKTFEGVPINLEVKDKDRYGRTVAILYHANKDMNLLMVKKGFAWGYTKYLDRATANTRTKYFEAQKTAKNNGLGLWQSTNSVPPWKWRRHQREPQRNKN